LASAEVERISMKSDNREQPKRETILAAAERVFDAKGYAGATIEAVAEEAHIAKGSVYNYFHSKRDLFNQVFARAIAGATAETQQIVADDLPAPDKLEAIVDHWFGLVDYHKQIGRLVLEFWATAAREEREGELADTFKHMYAQWLNLLGAVLSQGVREGRFAPVAAEPAAPAMILATLDGIMLQAILDTGIVVDRPFLAALKRSILAGLGGDAPPHGPEAS